MSVYRLSGDQYDILSQDSDDHRLGPSHSGLSIYFQASSEEEALVLAPAVRERHAAAAVARREADEAKLRIWQARLTVELEHARAEREAEEERQRAARTEREAAYAADHAERARALSAEWAELWAHRAEATISRTEALRATGDYPRYRSVIPSVGRDSRGRHRYPEASGRMVEILARSRGLVIDQAELLGPDLVSTLVSARPDLVRYTPPEAPRTLWDHLEEEDEVEPMVTLAGDLPRPRYVASIALLDDWS